MKKIGMMMYGYPLGVSPSIINSAILLALEGYEVHIYIDRPSFNESEIKFANKAIIIHIIDNNNISIWNKNILVFYKGKFKKRQF